MQSVGSSERRGSDVGQEDETREDRGADQPETGGGMDSGGEGGQGSRGGSRGRKSSGRGASSMVADDMGMSGNGRKSSGGRKSA